MTQKIVKSLIMLLILVGLVFTVFNFTPQLKADEVYFGTLHWVGHPEPWMEKYKVGDTGYYCLGEHSNCTIVIEEF